MSTHGYGRNAKHPRNENARLAKWFRQVEQANSKGVWDERTKSFIKPSGTVKQGRRPMFKPFEEGK